MPAIVNNSHAIHICITDSFARRYLEADPAPALSKLASSR